MTAGVLKKKREKTDQKHTQGEQERFLIRQNKTKCFFFFLKGILFFRVTNNTKTSKQLGGCLLGSSRRMCAFALCLLLSDEKASCLTFCVFLILSSWTARSCHLHRVTSRRLTRSDFCIRSTCKSSNQKEKKLTYGSVCNKVNSKES